MTTQTTEKAFETDVEEILLPHGGWKPAIKKPQGYPVSLIAAAVTGKIDVRKAAA